MKRRSQTTTLISLVMTLLFVGYQADGQQYPQGRVIKDEINGRQLQVYLPPTYEEDTSHYATIYMHDGQNLFDTTTAYSAEWEIDETLDKLIFQREVEPIVVVGIYNSSRRAEEYVPYYDERIPQMLNMDSWDSTLVDSYGQFVVEEVIPYIEGKYRVSPKSTDRALFGSSFGGLNALWLMYQYPKTFGFIGAMSPSLWVGYEALIHEAKTWSKPQSKVWLDIGTREWTEAPAALTSGLIKQGYSYGIDLFYFEDEEAVHHESSWSKRVENPIKLFKGVRKGGTTKFQVSTVVTANNFNPDRNWFFTTKLNPVLTLGNGVNYSLPYVVNYGLKDEDVGFIDDMGNVFFFNEEEDLITTVTYRHYRERVRLRHDQLQERIETFKKELGAQ